jgi:ABC-type amino acid transport substrate-binding protein
MRKLGLTLIVLSLLAFLGGASAFAQQAGAAAQQTSSTGSTAHHAMHHAAHHAHHAASQYGKYEAGLHTATGKLSTVDANGKLLIVTGADGTPFDFKVTRATRIQVNGQKGTLADLSSKTDQQVTVKFRDDLTRGLVARSVDISG